MAQRHRWREADWFGGLSEARGDETGWGQAGGEWYGRMDRSQADERRATYGYQGRLARGEGDYGYDDEFGEPPARGYYGWGGYDQRGEWAGPAAWRAAERPRGNPPRNYRRPDERIREDVGDRLTQHGRLDATTIYLEVKDGVVMLSGTVRSRWAKREAENVAYSVPGVQDVENRLRVSPSPWSGARIGRDYVRRGMLVEAADGELLGRAAEVRDNDFILDGPNGGILVPFELCASVMADRLRLNAFAEEIDELNARAHTWVNLRVTSGR